jgi:hypothetical protein
VQVDDGTAAAAAAMGCVRRFLLALSSKVVEKRVEKQAAAAIGRAGADRGADARDAAVASTVARAV